MKKILSVLIFSLLCSCSVTQRRYQKGFYISRKAHSTNKDNGTTIAGTTKTALPKIPDVKLAEASSENSEPLLATANETHMLLLSKQNKSSTRKKDQPCDQLLLRDGTELDVKVMEVSATEIRYKKCAEPDGPLYIEKASNVFRIRYINGNVDVITAPKRQAAVAPPRKRTHPMAVNALVLGIVGLSLAFTIIGALPTGILAIVFSIKALGAIKMYPAIFTGEGMARTGLYLGIGAIAAATLYLAFLLLT